jgi:SAM-dependent methyltransferase
MPQLATIKDDARTTWATGDYDAMMRQERLYGVGERLVERAGVERGTTVLDVACGTGNAAIPAARKGARVTGLDLTPGMLDIARGRAEDAGVDIEWIEGDAEDLPFDDQSFDVVLSAFGCMFAPRHEAVAEELVRVLRPGGRLTLCAWTPEGAIGAFFRTVAPHLPPLPSIVDPPPRFGEEDYVRRLFEGTGMRLRFDRETWDIEHASAAAAVECYTTTFGPVVEARRLGESEGRWPELERDLLELFEGLDRGDGTSLVFPAEYLVVLGERDD